MGDNENEIKKEEQPLIQMVIIFNPNTNQVQVSGPLHNRVLSYGMIEMAKEAIDDLRKKLDNKVSLQGGLGNLRNFLNNKNRR